MFKPTSKPTTEKPVAPQSAAARAAIAVQVTEVEYDTSNSAWVAFDAQMTSQLAALEGSFRTLATPLSLSKTFADKRR
jgi:hypothetical protein